MQRNFLRSFLICLIPCLLAMYFTFYKERRLGIDLAGGTILVYEVNLERTQERQQTQRPSDDPSAAPTRGRDTTGLSSDEMQRLAGAIKRRIDPADLKNVTVRSMGSSRLEIILPNMTADEIEEVKRLIRQVGVLEFRILANNTDDKEAIKDAEQIIRNESDAVEMAARKGTAPPAPTGEFDVMSEKVRYQWVELGPEERQSLGLSNAQQGSGLWAQLAANRGKTYLSVQQQVGERGDKTSSMLLYSRDFTNEEGLRREAEDMARLETIGKGGDHNPKKIEYYVLTRISPYDSVKVAGDVTLSASPSTDSKGDPAVSFTFNGAGGRLFGRMTERNKPDNQTNTVRHLAIVLDDKVVSAPTLNGRIESQGQITGKFDLAWVNRLVTILRSGALTAELRDRPVSENTIGPTLGQDTVSKGVRSVGLAFLFVLAFMLVYYRFAGMVACVALLANLLLTIGFMVAVNAAFTLPGLAGMVLMLGMAVDANVLIYERLREERNKGANLATAIRNGYERAFLTIIDTHLTSIFTSIVLYTFGNDQLKGFAISLAVGLIISLFTSLYMTRLMFDFWLKKGWLTELKMMRLFERPNFDFMKIRYYMFATTATLTVLGLGLFLYRGEKSLNVDFTRGTVYGGKLRDGEERAQTKSSDGKSGIRDLLSMDNQDKKLQVTSALWLNEPAEGDLKSKKAAVNEYIYEITYNTGEHVLVSLSGSPDGVTVEEMNQDVAARARHLPDSSVEQVFLSGEAFPDRKSKHFTVRTTEKEKELVQVALDRLLRNDGGDPLMASAKMTVGPVTGPRVKIEFSEETSPNYLSALLERSFRLKGALDDTGITPFTLLDEKFEPVSTALRYRTMYLDVSKNTKFSSLAEQNKAASDQETRKTTLVSAGGVLGGFAFTEAAVAAPTAKPEVAAEIKTLDEILKQTKETFDSRPVPERLETFDSQLAAETRTKAFIAIVISWIAIILYLWFRFGNWTFGTAAVLCLIHDLCFTLGAIAACHYLSILPGMHILGIEDFKIDLAAVAALLTLVGYSVNEIIVNFARIREVRGKSPVLTPQMINDSVNQTLSRTILTSTTVFLVSLVLYIFGGEGIHLFAFVMVMGVLISTYSSIFVASPLLLMFGEGTAEVKKNAPVRKEQATV